MKCIYAQSVGLPSALQWDYQLKHLRLVLQALVRDCYAHYFQLLLPLHTLLFCALEIRLHFVIPLLSKWAIIKVKGRLTLAIIRKGCPRRNNSIRSGHNWLLSDGPTRTQRPTGSPVPGLVPMRGTCAQVAPTRPDDPCGSATRPDPRPSSTCPLLTQTTRRHRDSDAYHGREHTTRRTHE